MGIFSGLGAVMSLLSLALCMAVGDRATAARTFYLSTQGNDAWSGTLPTPNADGTDGPFATLERARDEIREMKKAGGLSEGGVIVELRGGVYWRAQTFELTAEDAGTKEAPIVYRARAGETVRLVGGKAIGGFKPVLDPAVLSRLEPTARGRVLQTDLQAQGITDFGELKRRGFGQPLHEAALELFFQDRPMTLARWPNEGFVRIAATPAGKDGGQFAYEGDRPKRWTAEEDIWVHGYWFHDWADSYEKVEKIDLEQHIISTRPPHGVYGYKKGQRFYALNLLSELDQPGEWYLDRKTGLLYFWPPAPLEEGEAVVSLLPTLISLQDTAYITIQGLTLEVTRGTAVRITGGTHNLILGCTLRNLGNKAVIVSGGTANGVVGCDIYQTGDGGISLGGGDRQTLIPAGNYAENNHIYDYSRWCRTYRAALSIGGVGNCVRHNLIHDGPHNAIQLGGNDHIIEFNEIHRVCYETGDVGAFYMGRDWTARGTVIRYNFFHHIRGPGHIGAMGVYLDDAASGIYVYGNVFYRVTRAAFIGGGRDNIIENNIFVECNPAVHIDARGLGWMRYHVEEGGTLPTRLKAVPYQQPPWSIRYPRLVNILKDEPGAPKGNLIARNICVGGRWLEMEERARPYQTFRDNLLNEDPHFVDAANLNFQLREDSPAYQKIGFQPIPFGEIGLYHDGRRASWPVVHHVR
ncbi:MAG TPA: right-handed parallel beta-helix repeat-containing protein [Armatimonadetes bacterium]|nr:right-handed parallel beta-helix repeat-containing protein [Armatimonadota bacterium]